MKLGLLGVGILVEKWMKKGLWLRGVASEEEGGVEELRAERERERVKFLKKVSASDLDLLMEERWLLAWRGFGRGRQLVELVDDESGGLFFSHTHGKKGSPGL
ncbi:hypothetical protein OIU85_020426 [Salix viminalis]|uniref:Uncharacterized protein n=1 Tax=Salix viminalis TaxID=40686 RepID=A0A9Q0UG66_SALVM|nr:hypothetical protein OIU85_020426 [Salix viminalis]